MVKTVFFSLMLLFFHYGIYAGDVVFIVGPSCAGKSTIAHRVIKELDSNWILLEYDTIEEEMGRLVKSKRIFEIVMDKVEYNLANGKSVIVDSNVFFTDVHANYAIENNKIILVYAPLEILLERDTIRTEQLSRDRIKAERARMFVIKSFNRFFRKNKTIEFSGVFDTSKHSIDQLLYNIKRIIASDK